MIPQLVTLRYRSTGSRGLRLYVPVVPVVLVLSPLLLLLAAAGGLVACRFFQVSPVGALRGTARLLWALPGTRIDIDDGQTTLFISVR
jgi:hypothetical protein